MEAGADVMVTPCPLCHLSLDAWQQKLEASTGRTFDLPILHLAQLVGVAAGLEESELKFKRHIVDPTSGARAAEGLSARRLPAAGRPARLRRVGLVRGRLGAAARARARLPGLPAELDGLRIAHLSDFHLGVRRHAACRGRAGGRVGGAAAARPRRHHRRPAHAAARRDRSCASSSSGSQSRRTRCSATTTSRSAATRRRVRSNLHELAPATLLRDEGVDARAARPAGLDRRGAPADDRSPAGEDRPELALPRDADLRILLCHFPRVLDRLEPGRFDLVLAGHMHDGQICVPVPRRQDPARASDGAVPARRLPHRRPRVMHVSPGLGTTFVPFRFAARPEATELVLRRRYDRRSSGRPGLDLDGHPRAVRGRRGARGGRRARAVGELDPGTAGRCPRQQRGPASASRCTSSSTGARPSPRSGARCRNGCASTCCGWPTSSPRRSRSSSTRSARDQ